MKHSKPYKARLAQLEGATVGESFINGMRRALHTLDRKRNKLSTSITSSGMTKEELDALLDIVYEKHPRIEDAQAAKGIAWLLTKWKTPNGKERKHNPYGYREQQVLENFSHFTLVDFHDISRNYCAFYVPVYRVHSKDGATFDYYAAAWQSGGNGPEIVG
jgi:hypothetical protein